MFKRVEVKTTKSNSFYTLTFIFEQYHTHRLSVIQTTLKLVLCKHMILFS